MDTAARSRGAETFAAYRVSCYPAASRAGYVASRWICLTCADGGGRLLDREPAAGSGIDPALLVLPDLTGSVLDRLDVGRGGMPHGGGRAFGGAAGGAGAR